jgi:hypothetical protein
MEKKTGFQEIIRGAGFSVFFGFLLEQCVIKKSNDDNSEDVGTTLMTLN